jgi:hypothetical protein
MVGLTCFLSFKRFSFGSRLTSGWTVAATKDAKRPTLSPITSHQSPLTNHLSPLTSHLSPITALCTSTADQVLNHCGQKLVFRLLNPGMK